MKKDGYKYISICIDVNLLAKFKYIAKSEGRSTRGALKQLLIEKVRAYEKIFALKK